MKPHFEVDKKGLAKLLERRGKAFVVIELLQNAWDQSVTRVDVSLETLPGGNYILKVEDDDPEGFADLTHAYTLFAESEKKANPEQRGRFNLGEKLVVAVCSSATISTTKGTVRFTPQGRSNSKHSRESGSTFSGVLKLSKTEVGEIEETVMALLPPAGVKTSFNGEAIEQRPIQRTFTEPLRTEIAGEDGILKPTIRKTVVEVYDPFMGEVGTLYEMGIPVVPTGDRFHVNVMQKVPLNTDRDNVPPSYLRDVRAAVLNHAHDLLSADEATEQWVSNAMEAERTTPDAVRAVFKNRFGPKAVIYDPSDPEANKIAVEKGYTVVPGRSLSGPAWAKVKESGVAKPAGQVTPSPRPYHPDGEPLKLMEHDDYPTGVLLVVTFTHRLAERILGRDITIGIANDPKWGFAATYGDGQFIFNIGRLGYRFFEDGVTPEVLDLIIHEFGHEDVSDHLSRDYFQALTRIGAAVAFLALEDPELFRNYQQESSAAMVED